MSKTRKEILIAHKYKFLALFTSIFCITCLNLCAEEVSTAKAKTYRENLVREAKKYVGCPYTYGAAGPDEFDCSGLIYYVAHEANGTQLPRTAQALYSKSKIVPDKEKEPGDLLFFRTTTTGSISHVGIYIGNNQFISALSDGPNTGVILSSLNEAYWKPRYIGCGQIYKSGKLIEETHDSGSDVIKEERVSLPVLDQLVVDASLLADWSVLTSKNFMPNFRGVDFQTNARLSDKTLQPGFGLGFRWNYWIGAFQMPLTFSLTVNDNIRVYMGPVFTFGKSIIHDTDEEISPSIFPGVLGASFSTPNLTKGDVKVQLVQDIAYSVYNNTDNSALNIFKSITNGVVLYTGIRVSIPANIF
ncbi:MAG: C40 family peptidase [Treponema sp.]|nr:C40 family peptidase [Treponema sp.]